MKEVYVIYDCNAGGMAVFDTKDKLKDFIFSKKKEFWEEGLEFLEGEDYITYTCLINKGFE